MATTHTWNGAAQTSSGSPSYIYDPSDYTDGQPFAAGDTLLVNGGDPTIASTGATLAPLLTGTYQFTPLNGAFTGLQTDNIQMDAASTLAAGGPGMVQWHLFDQFVSDGTIAIGSPAGSATVDALLSAVSPVTFTNDGALVVQNASLLRFQPIAAANGTLVNAAGATISVGGGSALTLSSEYGYVSAGSGDVNTVNDGVIDVSGGNGVNTRADFEGSLTGSGLLSVRGAPGESAADTSATVAGAASNTFDIASGALEFRTTPVSGVINFRDNNASVTIDRETAITFNTPGYPFGATIAGFQAGDAIYINGGVAGLTGFTYDPASHTLTLLDAGGASLGQFVFAGNYQQSDFQTAPTSIGGLSGLEITTTSTANALPIVDGSGATPGQGGASGSDVFRASSGSDTITTGGGDNLVAPDSGNDVILANGNSVVLPDSGGNETIFAFGPALAAVGSGTMLFVNSSNPSTVIGGGAGSAVIGGGDGGGLYAGGTGGTNYILGGQGACTMFGGSGSDLLAAGGAGANLLLAGSGNETLTGLGSTGANVMYAGSGSDLLGGGAGAETFFAGAGNATVIGGSGADLYGFVNGLAGGAETVFGFDTAKGDRISLQNYAAGEAQNDLANAAVAGGNTTLTLSDKTQMTLIGVTGLTASAFV